MSWNDMYLSDLDLKLAVRGNHVQVFWTCPRCQKAQVAELSPGDIVDEIEISCNNVVVCGEGQSFFCFSLDIAGSYKGLLDRPLEK